MKTLLYYFSITLFISISSLSSLKAQELLNETKMQIEAAGQNLKNAKSADERITALREIEQIMSTQTDNDEARLMAKIIAQKALQEAGPAKMLEAMEALATSGQIKDIQTLGTIAAPFLSTIAQMREDGTLLPEAAIQVDQAIKKLNDAAAKLNLPSVTEVIDKATGDTKLAGKIGDAINQIATLADIAKKAPDINKMNEDAKKDFIRSLPGYSTLPPGAREVFADILVYDNEMANESAKALNLVADAMDTGQFDHEAYNKIQNRLQELAKGPWSKKSISDFAKDLCKQVPILSAWCDDIFKFGEKLFGAVDCDAINCDCDHVSGGLMRGPLIVECRIHEDTLRSECKANKKMGACLGGGSSGPAAYPK